MLAYDVRRDPLRSGALDPGPIHVEIITKAVAAYMQGIPPTDAATKIKGLVVEPVIKPGEYSQEVDAKIARSLRALGYM